MIYIYCDFYQIQEVEQDDYTWVASQIQEYIPLRQRIRRALDDPDHHYHIYVQNRILVKWLNDLRDYPSNRVKWQTINLREQFRKKFGFPLPPELDDTAVKKLELCHLSTPTRSEAEDPTGWILGQRLDPIWQPAEPATEHLANFAAWAVSAGQIEKTLAPLTSVRLKQWRQLDGRYQIFLTRPLQKAGEEILLKWALQSYPPDCNLRRQVAAAPAADCRRHRPLLIPILQKYTTEITRYWQLHFANTKTPDIAAVVQSMSGLSLAELRVLEEWLQNNPATLTEALWAAIQHRFADLPQAKESLRRLKTLIAPDIPQTPGASWSTEEWLAWASEAYMPYLAWVLRHNQARDVQMALAQHFEDWLLSVYPSLMFDKDAPFITNQPAYLQDLLEGGQADVIFWLIVDGLTWWQGKMLTDALVERGLTISQLEPHLSALPSLTFISKRALAQGYLDQSTERQPIKKLLEGRLRRNTPSAHVFTRVGQFESAISSDLQPGIYVLLYNALDTHNHESQKFTDDESVEGYLRLLARLTDTGFQQCLQQGLRARALISSDHGSALLPPDATALSVPSFAQVIEDEDLSGNLPSGAGKRLYRQTRACAVETLPEGEALAQIEQSWHILRRDIFNLPQHFLVPKGYAAVKRRPKGWTHGGATPEEAVTAFIEVQPETLDIVPPVVKIEGFLLPTQRSTLKITITNPNTTPLRALRLAFSGMEQPVEKPKVPPNSRITSDVSAPKASSRGKTQTIEWQFTCEAGGRSWQFSGQEEIPVRRFQHSEVDDLFEDML